MAKSASPSKGKGFSVRSKSDAHDALVEMRELQQERQEAYDAIVKPYDDKLAKIKAALEKYTLAKFAPGTGLDDEEAKVTVVQSHRRYWDGEKLAKLLPKGLFLKVVDYTPNAAKIDELVRAGKIDRKKIEPAFIEEPNTPYVKITTKKDTSGDGEQEAASLADKLA